MKFQLLLISCAYANRADQVFGHIKKERIRLGPVDNPPGLIHFYPYRDFAIDNAELRKVSLLTQINSDFSQNRSIGKFLNWKFKMYFKTTLDEIINSVYIDDPKNRIRKSGGSFAHGSYPPTITVSLKMGCCAISEKSKMENEDSFWSERGSLSVQTRHVSSRKCSSNNSWQVGLFLNNEFLFSVQDCGES